MIISIMKSIYKKIRHFFYLFFLQLLLHYCKININNKKKEEKSLLLIAGFGKYGGTRTYIEKLIEYFIKYNYSVFFLQNKKNINENGMELLKNKIKFIKYNYSFNTPINMLISIIKLYRIINKYKINFTFISEGDCGYYLPCILLKTSNILIEHTVPFEKTDLYREKILKKINKNTKIVCVSDFQRNEILKKWGNYLNDYCFVINNSSAYNFLNKEIFFPEKKTIITAAHFIDYKNPDLWLSLAEKLTQKYNALEFKWMGDGKILSSYKEMVSKNKSIKLPGYCNQGQIKEEYKNAFLYLALSKIESLGIAVIDALNAGLPAIVLNTGGLPEVVESGKCGFVVNSEDEAIEKIELLLNNSKLYYDMCKNAKNRYNQVFSNNAWENKMKSLMEIQL